MEYKQKESGSMAYPKKWSWNWLLFKSPVIWWRMGLGPVLSHPALGGNRMLALSCWGRKSGKERHTMLSMATANETDYVCSGWGRKSDWVKNIIENPQVTVQVGRRIYAAAARRVADREEYAGVIQAMFETGGDSHFEDWLESYGIEFNEDDMLEKRDRLTIFALDPSDSPGPPQMPADLRWVWGVLAVVLVGVWWLVS